MGLAGVAVLVGSVGWVRATAHDHLYAEADVPAAPVVLVLGAQVFPDGTPSPFLAGRLDVAHAPDVRLALAEQVRTGSDELVLDLAALTAVDVTGLGVLVGAHRHAGRAGRRLILRDATEPVARVLHVTRLDRVLRQERSARAA